MQGRFDAAGKAFAEAQRLRPSARNLLNLVQLHTATGRRSKAQALMREWLNDRPRSLLVAIALAESHLAANELDAARVAYERVLAIDARNAGALNNLATVLQRQGDQRALDFARQAHALAPEVAEINDTLGWVLVSQGEAQEGLRFLREAFARQGQNPEIRYHIAEALAALGRDGEARRELKAALKLSQTFPGAEQARALQKRLSR